MSIPLDIVIYEYALPLESQQLDAWKWICLNVLMLLKNLSLLQDV